MIYRITKAVLTKNNGDKLLLKEVVEVGDLEVYRQRLKEKYDCTGVTFTYSEMP